MKKSVRGLDRHDRQGMIGGIEQRTCRGRFLCCNGGGPCLAGVSLRISDSNAYGCKSALQRFFDTWLASTDRAVEVGADVDIVPPLSEGKKRDASRLGCAEQVFLAPY